MKNPDRTCQPSMPDRHSATIPYSESGSRNTRQPVSSMRGKHSEKLWQVQDRIVQMFPHQPKIELYARERFDGWDALGNQVESDIEL